MTRVQTLRAGLLAGAVLPLAAAVVGCNKAETVAVVPGAVAPVAPTRVEPEVLPAVKFVDVTEPAGITFTHSSGARGEKLLPETMGSGVAALDYDYDGDIDLFFVNAAPWPWDRATSDAPAPTQALYRNDGDWHFTDVTKEAGLDVTLIGQGVAVGDYDGDGDPDLFLTAVGECRLFRNDGGQFADVTEAAHANASGGWPTSAAFFDMDDDGDLDLFVCEYVRWTADYDRSQGFQLAGTDSGRAYGRPQAFEGSLSHLLRNDGGTFTDVSESSGIQVRTPDLKVPMGKSLGVAPFDVDGDGLVDLAVANDTVQNFLFHNLGDGKFEEVAIISGVAFDQSGNPRGGMGIDWAHFRNDQSLALGIGNFANEMIALYVADDPAGFQFSDLANIYGLGAPSQPPLKFGLFFFDYDLDGRLDLLAANGHLESDIEKVQASERYRQPAQLYWNTGRKGRAMFALVGPEAAGSDLFRPIVGRGSTYADLDGDGDLDVVLTNCGGRPSVLRNDGGNRSHWLRLSLVGTDSNREAIGARVTLRAGGTEQSRQLFPAKGYLSSVELPLTFGLGSTDTIDSVAIAWPSGQTTELKDLAADRVYTIVEGSGLR